jgi:hypothetical protein
MVVQTTCLENNLAILDPPHALKGTITKTIAQGLLKRMQGLVVSLGQEPPVVVIIPAQPARCLIGQTYPKPITRSCLMPKLSKFLTPSKHTVVVRRVLALANFFDHKGSNLSLVVVLVVPPATPISLRIAIQVSSKYIISSSVNLSVCRLIKVVLVCLVMWRKKPFLPMRPRSPRKKPHRWWKHKEGKKCHHEDGGVHHDDNEVGGKQLLKVVEGEKAMQNLEYVT